MVVEEGEGREWCRRRGRHMVVTEVEVIVGHVRETGVEGHRVVKKEVEGDGKGVEEGE